MNNTERDEKQHTKHESGEERLEEREAERGSTHRLPLMPAADDDSPLGDTDQHAD